MNLHATWWSNVLLLIEIFTNTKIIIQNECMQGFFLKHMQTFFNAYLQLQAKKQL